MPVVETTPNRGRPSGPVGACDPAAPTSPASGSAPVGDPLHHTSTAAATVASRLATAGEAIQASDPAVLPNSVNSGERGKDNDLEDAIAITTATAAAAALTGVAISAARKRNSPA
jgi:hypothetical protein